MTVADVGAHIGGRWAKATDRRLFDLCKKEFSHIEQTFDISEKKDE